MIAVVVVVVHSRQHVVEGKIGVVIVVAVARLIHCSLRTYMSRSTLV